MAFNHCFQVSGDLALNEAGTDFVVTAGAPLVLQQIRARAEIWVGTIEWDPEAGLPMLQAILVKGPDLRVVTAIWRDFFLSTPGVAALDSLSVTLERALRRLDVAFRVTAEDGSSVADVLSFTQQ